MTLEEATVRLEAMTAADVDPTLTDAEITRLLAMAARPDEYDLEPPDTGWTPTYDLATAAAQGWRWKAGKVTERVGFNVDGAAVNRHQMFQHCMAMASAYARGIVGTAQVGADLDE